MSEDAIHPSVSALIAEHIDSVVQVEILVLLHAQPQRRWSATDIGQELRIDPAWAATQLQNLCQRGIITCDDPGPPTLAGQYHFGAKSPNLDDAVRGLVKAYDQRRVTVIGMIFAKPIDKIRSFADAFRIRKDKSDG